MASRRKQSRGQPQYLDLIPQSTQSHHEKTMAIDVLRNVLQKRKNIVVIAGAGISVSAGIPDFRSSDGLFQSLRNKNKLKSSGKDLFDASVYKDDALTAAFHKLIREISILSQNAKPTAFHQMLASLAFQGRLLRLYTQNIDGLDTVLPPLATEIPLNHKAPWPRTIQLHGSLEKMICQKCQHISPLDLELFNGPVPPDCSECARKDASRILEAGKRSHGIGRLRPRIVLYNEHHPDDEAIGAVTTFDLRHKLDAVVVVGTSLKVDAVKRIVQDMSRVVRDRKDGMVIWINRDPLPQRKEYMDTFNFIVRGDADEVATIAGLPQWDHLANTAIPYTEDTLPEDHDALPEDHDARSEEEDDRSEEEDDRSKEEDDRSEEEDDLSEDEGDLSEDEDDLSEDEDDLSEDQDALSEDQDAALSITPSQISDVNEDTESLSSSSSGTTTPPGRGNRPIYLPPWN